MAVAKQLANSAKFVSDIASQSVCDVPNPADMCVILRIINQTGYVLQRLLMILANQCLRQLELVFGDSCYFRVRETTVSTLIMAPRPGGIRGRPRDSLAPKRQRQPKSGNGPQGPLGSRSGAFVFGCIIPRPPRLPPVAGRFVRRRLGITPSNKSTILPCKIWEFFPYSF